MTSYVEKAINSDHLPLVWEFTLGEHDSIETLCEFLSQNKEAIDNIVNQTGALLLRGFAHYTNPQDYESLITSIYPKLMDYVGGTSPRGKLHNNILEATYTPETWSIPPHQEMAYTKNPPRYIAFFCAQAAQQGGLSTLCDMRKVTEQIKPDLFEKFKTHGVQLRRTLLSKHDLAQKPGVKKSWQEVFATEDLDEAQRLANAKGWQVELIQENAMWLWQDVLPATRKHEVTQAEIWCNQAHFFAPACMFAWAEKDGRMQDALELRDAMNTHVDLLDNVYFGHGEPIPAEEALYILDVLYRNEFSLALEKGDLLILDNLLVAHGRTAFEGTRKIMVALVPQ